MEEISKKAWEEISERQIKPEPKYKFLVKRYVFWIGATITIILGAVSLAVVFYFWQNQNWSIYNQSISFWEVFFLIIPYFWLLALVGFIYLAYYNLKHTQFGYRYKFKQVIVAYFIVSIAAGFTLYQLGLAETLERTFINNVPFYQRIVYHRFLPMQRPTEGRLAGTIIEFSNNDVKLLDLGHQTWLIDTEDARIHPAVKLIIGENIRVGGDFIDQNHFEAEFIAPMLQPGPGKNLKDLDDRKYLPMRGINNFR